MFYGRRALGFFLSVLALGAALPSPSSAQVQTPARGGCNPLILPEDLASEVEDFRLPGVLCAGQRLTVEVEDSERRVEAPNIEIRENESEVEVRRSRPVTPTIAEPAPLTEPPELEVEDLAQLGYATKVEESTVVHERNGERTEEREESTRVRGDDFEYDSEKEEEIEERPGFSSSEEESEEEFRTRR